VRLNPGQAEKKNSIISIEDLTFAYGNKIILSNVSFDISSGEFLCLLGANGAGKSTLIRILTGQLSYKKGKVRLFSKDINVMGKNLMKDIGVLTDNITLPEEFTVDELLTFSTRAFGYSSDKTSKIICKLIDDFDLAAYKDVVIKKLSSGLKRRVEIAQTLVNESEIIFLDEPTNALDPKSSNEIRQLIRDLNNQGITIVYSTHLLQEIEEIYTTVCIINNGKIKAYSRNSLNSGSENNLILRFNGKEDIDVAKNLITEHGYSFAQDKFILSVCGDDLNINLMLDELRRKHIMVAETSIGKINLNMLFNNAVSAETIGVKQ